MKYCLLVGEHYYPSSRFGDEAGVFNTQQEAEDWLQENGRGDWATIIDSNFNVVANFADKGDNTWEVW